MAGLGAELNESYPWLYWNTGSGYRVAIPDRLASEMARQYSERVLTEHFVVLDHRGPGSAGFLVLIHKDLIDGDT